MNSTGVFPQPIVTEPAHQNNAPDGAGGGVSGRISAPRTPVSLVFYLLAWAVVFWAAIALPSLEDICCFTVLNNKHQVLEQAGSPKIILTGGSNVLFGVDSEKIGKVFNRKVVDMGLCLMFPLSYLFEEIKDSIKPGDIVVLSPEYQSYSQEFARPMIMADILDGCPRAIEWILKCNGCTWDEKGKILFHLRTLGLQKLQYVISHARQIVQHRATWSYNKPNPGLVILNAKNLNSCGDLVWHLDKPVGKDAMERKILIRAPKHIDDYTINEVSKFDAFCKSHGAQFVLIPPSIPESMYQKGKTDIDNVIEEAKVKFPIPILATADRYAFADEHIFGGHYHLDKVGRDIRTDRMIEDLRTTVAASRTQ
ncbi:MAG: hypothetical protein EKK48_23080 [Candidatus Melainabacteria bacterium]|nr:MAG: hypothetical protein EKK48_23080 [Candidatus Melainabacteria bacterium]